MVAIKAEDGSLIRNRDKIVERCTEFYRKLYSSDKQRPSIKSTCSKDIPEVLSSEVEHAVKHIKYNKAPEDEIAIELIKEGDNILAKQLVKLFTNCLISKRVPGSWNNAIIILLHKKGYIKNINNYRPISLMSQISKLFSKVILNRKNTR